MNYVHTYYAQKNILCQIKILTIQDIVLPGLNNNATHAIYGKFSKSSIFKTKYLSRVFTFLKLHFPDN